MDFSKARGRAPEIPMTQDDIIALADTFIKDASRPLRSATVPGAGDYFDLAFNNLEGLWSMILEVLGRDPPDQVIAVLAAGPLEEYLAQGGDQVIGRVETQAGKDPKFRHLLGGVWKNSMSDEVWARVQACRDPAW